MIAFLSAAFWFEVGFLGLQQKLALSHLVRSMLSLASQLVPVFGFYLSCVRQTLVQVSYFHSGMASWEL